jgi:hypothetical protein
MKRAVSVSIGSSTRDKAVEIKLLGERVRLERIGTDGDMEAAAGLFRDLDGKVDAFGVGGTDLALLVGQRSYKLHSVQKLVRHVKLTPYVDGGGLKDTLERQLAPFIDRHLGSRLGGRRAFVASAVDRYGMACSFAESGYDCVFGDLMFALGIPIPLRSLRSVRILAALLIPVVGRLPFEWLYPTGHEQEVRKPKWPASFAWATVVAGDALYIKRRMPDSLPGRVIATNTTTPADVAFFRQAGVRALVSSTPVLDGRTFGTNMMEAALVAVAGKRRALTRAELQDLLTRLKMTPQIQILN